MVPIVGGPRASVIDHDHDRTLRRVGYPLPLPTRRATGGAVDPASLVALLGAPRARLLALLDQPASNAALAGRLQMAPSGISHHVNALVAAGLVVRLRQGRHVFVQRTARGDALLALYRHWADPRCPPSAAPDGRTRSFDPARVTRTAR